MYTMTEDVIHLMTMIIVATRPTIVAVAAKDFWLPSYNSDCFHGIAQFIHCRRVPLFF